MHLWPRMPTLGIPRKTIRIMGFSWCPPPPEAARGVKFRAVGIFRRWTKKQHIDARILCVDISLLTGTPTCDLRARKQAMPWLFTSVNQIAGGKTTTSTFSASHDDLFASCAQPLNRARTSFCVAGLHFQLPPTMGLRGMVAARSAPEIEELVHALNEKALPNVRAHTHIYTHALFHMYDYANACKRKFTSARILPCAKLRLVLSTTTQTPWSINTNIHTHRQIYK